MLNFLYKKYKYHIVSCLTSMQQLGKDSTVFVYNARRVITPLFALINIKRITKHSIDHQ